MVTSVAAAPNGGFWVQGDDCDGNIPGGTRALALHGAPVFENIPSSGSIAAIPGGNGNPFVDLFYGPRRHIRKE
jgi:hypothetical protein